MNCFVKFYIYNLKQKKKITGDITPRISNITFTFPPSPILSQSYDLSSDMVCNNEKKPKQCVDNAVCECVHVINIPLESRVEVILIDKGNI